VKQFGFIIVLAMVAILIALAIVQKWPRLFGIKPGVASSASSSSDSSPSNAPSEEDDPIYDIAVTALNSDFGEASFSHYAEEFDLDKGPPGNEDQPSIYTINSESQDSLNKLQQAIANQPTDKPLVAVSANYVQTSNALAGLLAPAAVYYEQQNYNDDQYAKGKAMHPALVAAYRAQQEATENLRAELLKISDADDVARLAKLKSDGKELSYDLLLNLSQARTTLHYIEAEYERKQDLDLIDIRPLAAHINDLSASLDAIQKQSQGADGGDATAKQYADSSESFLVACKYLFRAIRDNTPISSDSFALGGGTETDIVSCFNNMVNAYNGPG
jgi:hypothetical protein